MRDLLVFWSPLASTWLMMAFEGPFLAAIIARLAEPKINLAAFGVSYAIAMIVEAPVIMMLSAATALAEDRRSFVRLRRFTYALNGAATLVMLVLLVPFVFDGWARGLIGLPDSVANLTWASLVLLLPWPGAIGYRRLYQGVMIRRDQTRRVAYGTVVRLAAMTAMAVAASWATDIPGSWVGAAALAAGVSAEALASRVMARGAVRAVCGETARSGELTYPFIVRFYVPLALTSFIGLASQPVTTFFMGQALFPLESLAVLPVVISLVFIFRSLGLAYQDVAITFLARDEAHTGAVLRFAAWLAAAATLGMAAIAFTPLSGVWFGTISGLSIELIFFALPPTRIMVLLPAMSVALSLQRAILVHGRTTRPVTVATALEMTVIIAVLLLTIQGLGMVGATAAAIAFVLGRASSNLFLVPPCLDVLRAPPFRP